MGWNPFRRQRSGPGPTAADTYAALTRQQWQDWVTQFVPFENQLIDYAFDANLIGENMQRAIGNVQEAFAVQPRVVERRVRSYGIQLGQDEQQAVQRETDLARSLAEVGAANRAKRATQQQQRAIMGAPMPQG